MGEFVAATLSFPTVLFTFALVVVIAYWLLVLVGGTEIDILDGDVSGESPSTASGLGALGLGGVPVTVAVSGLVTLSWFASLVGTVALAATGLGGAVAVAAAITVVPLALIAAVAGTRLVVIPLRRFFREQPAPSHTDFVGRICVIRTGRVDEEFGQAELVSADGSSAIIQVRQTERHAATAPLKHGDSAVVYDYDRASETFWVAPTEGI
ncbi:hypothetical protein IU433_24410 [Nocardia puris]|uniref:DUF1449 family protein n=1 Tax=Nocardia puris TaxID=208602 RepID=A0A366DHG4_9NOCA|nr:hypothetical protein [Nocardia puris]MBF6213278.1 hypothetical protein [Nocardia puris]MBF6369870.1 hypothetical protein [Nocardia puris]MBF6462157.1 hypothetical protein [Nocardia puris]RBO89461.1 hypothetical protein DFR74_107139 [Nocardia puris]